MITVLGRCDSYKGVLRIKLIIHQICIKTMSVKRGVYVHEAYEAKKICYVNTWDRHGFIPLLLPRALGDAIPRVLSVH